MGLRLAVRSLWNAAPTPPAVYEFDQTRIVVGRRRGADVLLPHPAVSLHHATIDVDGARYSVRDEGSTNGTRINGQRLAPGRSKSLRAQDRLEVGGFVLEVTFGATTEPTSAEDTRALALRLLREVRDENPTDAPSLVILNGVGAGTRTEMPNAPCSLVIGRGESCDFRIDDADASREHAEVERSVDGVRLRDLDSKNGVLVNRRRIRGVRRLADRDEITIGATVVAYEDPAAAKLISMCLLEEAVVELPEASREIGLSARQGEEPSTDEVLDSEPASAESDGDSIAPTKQTAVRVDPGFVPAAEVSEVLTGAARSSGARADTLIYALAGTILALSVAALIWLLG